MEILVVTSLNLLQDIQVLIDKITKANWVSFQFRRYDFASFEQTTEYTALSKETNWSNTYDRSKRDIDKYPWSFWLEKAKIRFILMHPLTPTELRWNIFAHEVSHMATCDNEISTLIDQQLNHPLVKEFRKRLNVKDDRGQLLDHALHVLQIQKEILADRWLAEKSREMLESAIDEACSVGTKNAQHLGELGHSLGYVLMCLRQYFVMQLKLSLAQQYQMKEKTSTISNIIEAFEQAELVKLVVERKQLWNLASKMHVIEYTAKTVSLIRKLSKTMPLKSSKVVQMPTY